MSTKSAVLTFLEQNRGKSLSGEEIAESLGLTRSAVWKAVASLKQDGYEIRAVQNRGYALMPQNDILSAEGIRPYLNDPSVSSGIAVYDSLASTNRTAKEIASEGGGKIFAVIADGQTDGKGRAKKPFFSPPKSGLYLSLILSPERYAFENLTDVTVVAAAAVCLSIQKVCGIETAVKPVNDIFKDGKKVCGILTEAVVDLEGGTAEWIVVGIGLNVGASAFPPELKNIACSLYDTPLAGGIRNRLAAEILNQFGRAAEKDFFETMKQEYQKRLIVIR